MLKEEEIKQDNILPDSEKPILPVDNTEGEVALSLTDVEAIDIITKPSVKAQYQFSLEKKHAKLTAALRRRSFDVAEELLDLYTLGKLTDKERLGILTELMSYLYPKLKPLGNEGDQEGNTQNNNVIQVIYTNKEIVTEEESKQGGKLDLGY